MVIRARLSNRRPEVPGWCDPPSPPCRSPKRSCRAVLPGFVQRAAEKPVENYGREKYNVMTLLTARLNAEGLERGRKRVKPTWHTTAQRLLGHEDDGNHTGSRARSQSAWKGVCSPANVLRRVDGKSAGSSYGKISPIGPQHQISAWGCEESDRRMLPCWRQVEPREPTQQERLCQCFSLGCAILNQPNITSG